MSCTQFCSLTLIRILFDHLVLATNGFYLASLLISCTCSPQINMLIRQLWTSPFHFHFWSDCAVSISMCWLLILCQPFRACWIAFPIGLRRINFGLGSGAVTYTAGASLFRCGRHRVRHIDVLVWLAHANRCVLNTALCYSCHPLLVNYETKVAYTITSYKIVPSHCVTDYTSVFALLMRSQTR